MKLHFTSGYHPKGDGQTEQMNQTLEQYLRVYCNYQQDNWSDLLPIAEFAYNNAPNATTGISPFFANKGYHPSITACLDRDLVSSTARHFVTDLEELHTQLRRPFPRLKPNTQLQLIVDGFQHQNSELEIRYLSSQITSVPLGPRKNFQRSSLVLLPLLPKLVLTRSPFIYQRACVLSTQFSMSP